MQRKDYQEGVYKSGRFMPYEMHGEYHAELDPASSADALNAGRQGQLLHGSFKDGVFRPADIRGREGFMSKIHLPSGDSYRLNYRGEFFDQHGKVVGRIEETGRASFYMRKDSSESPRKHGGDVVEERVKYRDVKLANGKTVRLQNNPSLTNLARYIARSNKVLGKLGRNQQDYDIPAGTDVKVYETEIPEAKVDARGNPIGAGYNAETTSGKEHIVVVDRRLKPYQKLAVVTHELSHVTGKRGGSLDDERATQTAAINHLSALYADYDALSHAVAGTDNPFFDVRGVPKQEIGKAVAFLVASRRHFDVRDEELASSKPVLRRIVADLEGRLEAFLFIGGFLGGLLFLSSNITGNAVANMTNSTTNFVGASLFVISLIAGFSWLNSRKK